MAFIGDDFVRMSAQANGSSQFEYTSTGDTIADIIAANYFNEAADPTGGYGLKPGDYILATGTDGTRNIKVAIDASNNVTVQRSLTYS